MKSPQDQIYIIINKNKIVIKKQSSEFNLYITGVDSDQLSGLGVQIVSGLKPIFYFFDSISLIPGVDNTFTKTYSKFSYPLLVQKNRFKSIEYFLSNYDKLTGVLVKYWCMMELKAGQPTSTGEVQLFLFDLLQEPHYNYKVRSTQLMSLDHRVINTFNTQKFYFKEIDTTFSDKDVGMASVNNYNNQALKYIIELIKE